MTALLYISLGLVVIYGLFIGVMALFFLLSNSKITEAKGKKITILIPFRNESIALPSLIDSLKLLSHPKDCFEVLFVDDHSTDLSVSIISEVILESNIDYQTIANKGKGKKSALETGVEYAKYNTIYTTDADCKLPINWISGIKTDLSLGITLKQGNNSVLQVFQEIESLMLAGITLGSAKLKRPILASGANLAYNKDFFESINPYASNKNIGSGDDMFLLDEALKQDIPIGIRKSPPVITKPKQTISQYLSQSQRWFGKTTSLNSLLPVSSGLIVFFVNILFLIHLILTLFDFNSISFIFLGIKFLVDFLFLFLTSTYYKRSFVLLYAPIIAVLYPIYLLALSVRMIIFKQDWKENV